MSCENQLKHLGMFSLEKTWSEEKYMIAVFIWVKGSQLEEGLDFLKASRAELRATDGRGKFKTENLF